MMKENPFEIFEMETPEEAKKASPEELKAILTKEADKLNAVPVPSEHKSTMDNWGYKKRVRYVELVESGTSPKLAFTAVEFNKGELQ